MKRPLFAAASLALAVCSSLLAVPTAQAQKRVVLKLLLIANGDTPIEAFAAGLDEALVPYTKVDLNTYGRPTINDAFLSRTTGGVREAKFQGVVMANEAPSGLSSAELASLRAFEREFNIRQLDMYVYPSPAVGLNWPVAPSYLGPLDGLEGGITEAGRSAGFGYLVGPVPFEDIDPNLWESYGYLSTPLATPAPDTNFTTFVEMPIPDTAALGVLAGVFNDAGREEMVLTAAMNQYQLQQQVLFRGLLDWVTYGVHFGTDRNYLAVHIDDVFLSDARWVPESNCTVGDDCPANITAPEILMTPADVDHLLAWQQAQGIKLDMAFNGAGHDEAMDTYGSYPVGQKLIQHRDEMRWINHTYTHMNLGCLKDNSATPWVCQRDWFRRTRWVSFSDAYTEIYSNIWFAARNDIPMDNDELVTGEHSGLARLPQHSDDNPNLRRAIDILGIKWVGSDSSREQNIRSIGNGRTLPRYPMSIYYNVGTRQEEVDEYNWIYTSRANGGSGLCEDNPLSTCIAPLDLETGFEDYLVPLETRFTLLHMLGNSPKPHYAHQSNLAEDRVLYPVLDSTLAQYRALFQESVAIVNPTMTQSGEEMLRHNQWPADVSEVTAYVQNGVLNVSSNGGWFSSDKAFPITLPQGSSTSGLSPYAGSLTGWDEVSRWRSRQFTLSSSVGYAR